MHFLDPPRGLGFLSNSASEHSREFLCDFFSALTLVKLFLLAVLVLRHLFPDCAEILVFRPRGIRSGFARVWARFLGP